MSGSHRPHDDPAAAAEPEVAGERADDGPDVDAAGAGSEPRTVAGDAEAVQEPDAPAEPGEQGSAARRHADRLERHSEREKAPIEPSSPTPPGSPRETPR